MAVYPGPTPPPAHRRIGFVDGENFTIRGQKIAADRGVSLVEGALYQRDQFLWIPGCHVNIQRGSPVPAIQHWAERVNYYTTVSGDDQKVASVTEALWRLYFAPQVFKKKGGREQKAKGVDIALTRDMLVGAFMGHYETAVLLSGDADYVPVIEEVKRFGKRVLIHFFKECVPDALLYAADGFEDLTEMFIGGWQMGTNKPARLR